MLISLQCWTALRGLFIFVSRLDGTTTKGPLSRLALNQFAQGIACCFVASNGHKAFVTQSLATITMEVIHA
jgi:hypothetical protein